MKWFKHNIFEIWWFILCKVTHNKNTLTRTFATDLHLTSSFKKHYGHHHDFLPLWHQIFKNEVSYNSQVYIIHRDWRDIWKVFKQHWNVDHDIDMHEWCHQMQMFILHLICRLSDTLHWTHHCLHQSIIKYSVLGSNQVLYLTNCPKCPTVFVLLESKSIMSLIFSSFEWYILPLGQNN